MDNQHRKIKGYRELNEAEILAMNQVKEIAAMVGEVVDAMAVNGALDTRWVAIGRTQLQQGFMALTRAVAKPDFF